MTKFLTDFTYRDLLTYIGNRQNDGAWTKEMRSYFMSCLNRIPQYRFRNEAKRNNFFIMNKPYVLDLTFENWVDKHIADFEINIDTGEVGKSRALSPWNISHYQEGSDPTRFLVGWPKWWDRMSKK